MVRKERKKRIDRRREVVSRRAKSRDGGWYLQRKYFPRPRFHDRDIFASKWRIDRKVNFDQERSLLQSENGKIETLRHR